MAKPVLRHRIFTNFNADAEGVDADQIIDRLLESVAEPAYGEKEAPPSLVVIDDRPECPNSLESLARLIDTVPLLLIEVMCFPAMPT